MRIAGAIGLATALVALAAHTGSAFSVTVVSDYTPGALPPPGSPPLGVSDTVALHIYVDVPETGLSLFSISAVAESSIFEHVPLPACPVTSPTAGCGSPTYILYAPPGGTTAATLFYPQQNPFVPWTGIKPPGLEQVNINYAESALADGLGTGLGIWVATIVWHVADLGDGLGDIDVSVSNNGNAVRINGVFVDTATIPITWVPEPEAALLLGLGLMGLAARSRRRSARR